MDLGFPELLLIGLVLVIFFGPKKLPELGASLGKAIREFKRSTNEPASQLSEQKTEKGPALSVDSTAPDSHLECDESHDAAISSEKV
jgi:sec-independent protein translocase protein TatA